MAAITVANMRKGVLLHKLILIEIFLTQLIIGGWQSFNLFWSTPTYGWWLSTAAVGLHLSTGLHNIIAWLKLRPFMSPRSSTIFLATVLLVQPYWILEMYATYAFFNNLPHGAGLFPHTRPVETVFRDPWWVAACGRLLWVLKSHYDLTLLEVMTISPRFAVMLLAMALSIVFVLLDILSVTEILSDALPVGVNPFWKLALVFKCLTDTVILDDFKTALDRLWEFRRTSLTSTAGGTRGGSGGGSGNNDPLAPPGTVVVATGSPFVQQHHQYERQPSEASSSRDGGRVKRNSTTSREYGDYRGSFSQQHESPRQFLDSGMFEMQPPEPASARF